MSRIVDFNRFRPPILTVPLMDEAKTVLHVVPPTVDLQEELRARSAELSALLMGGGDETVGAFYTLAANLMSCNRDLKRITGEQLRVVYNLDTEDLIVFFDAYSDFLKELEASKN